MKTKSLILAVAIILTSTAAFAGSGFGTSGMIFVKMEYIEPYAPNTVARFAGNNVTIPNIKEMPAGMTTEQQVQFLNNEIKLPQALIDSEVDIFYSTDGTVPK